MAFRSPFFLVLLACAVASASNYQLNDALSAAIASVNILQPTKTTLDLLLHSTLPLALLTGPQLRADLTWTASSKLKYFDLGTLKAVTHPLLSKARRLPDLTLNTLV
jgi:hypothetical protein